MRSMVGGRVRALLAEKKKWLGQTQSRKALYN
jgi:hypothetical protein